MKRLLKFIVTFVLIFGVLGGIYYTITNKQVEPTQQVEEKIEEKEEENQEEITYKEANRPTALLQEIYPKLVNMHTHHSELYEPQYAAAYFACDFFTWSNKTDREDIGGINLVLPQLREDFASYALRDYYVNLLELQEQYGAKKLQEVVSYKINSSKSSDYIYEADGFEDLKYIDVDLSFEYEESDLYDVSILKSDVVVTLVNYNDFWYVVGIDVQK